MSLTFLRVFLQLGLFLIYAIASAQTPARWHGIQRELHYKPQGRDFIKVKGDKRFNRALYGTNTAFRIETGDLPEFAMYAQGMIGNCKIGLIAGGKSKWLTEAGTIKTIYRPGSMIYEITDPLLNKGSITLTVLALADKEGMIIKASGKNISPQTELLIAFGGVSGKKFSRDGDIGDDGDQSFDLKPEYCRENIYEISGTSFQLTAGPKDKPRLMSGVFPARASVQLTDATQQQAPLQMTAAAFLPVITGRIPLKQSDSVYFLVQKQEETTPAYQDLATQFSKAEAARRQMAERVIVNTPDEYINTLGGALSIAADGIWEDPCYMHGAVAWRMRLPGWRGAYVADLLGWHDRARKNFSSYALSQVTEPAEGPVTADSAMHLARRLEKMGTSMFSNGYISRNPGGDKRPHHYDMNLVYIDQLLNHFNWTGDKAYVKEMWPVLQRHLAWEKRNFDADDDGLYDAYACIWASDALQYSGGGVTHSTAYNYRANKSAAALAKMIGEDGSLYEKEAEKIIKALNTKLWLKDKGWFAEYIDVMGDKMAHPAAGVWTVYHAMEAGVPDRKQQQQLLRYVDNHIPHIPVDVKELPNENLYLVSTTNWQPYIWSVNNVVLAEVLHTALAYWQGGENDNAFRLWKSVLIESMYLSSAPGNFQQISAYDAVRGELYRDFADPIGVAARTLVEGLFGVLPDALNDKLLIKPGLPSHWKFAQLITPDMNIDFKQNNNTSVYKIQSSLTSLQLIMQLKAMKDKVTTVKVNGKPAAWKWIDDNSSIEINAGKQGQYTIEVVWSGITIAPQSGWKRVTAKPVPATEKGNFSNVQQQPLAIGASFNDKVTQVFENRYLSPRPNTTTLQIPWQGIGDWCSPLATTTINDSGLRRMAGEKNEITLPNGLRFSTPSESGKNNIVFASRWDNYPDSVVIPAKGKGSHAYLLMAGTTNHMQSQMINGQVRVTYTDGTNAVLDLNNPETWWPVDQDYYEDGFAYHLKQAPPLRVHLKDGKVYNGFAPERSYHSIKGLTNRAIDGGAATVLDMPLDKSKEIESITVKAIANEVVIGLMSVTLINN